MLGMLLCPVVFVMGVLKFGFSKLWYTLLRWAVLMSVMEVLLLDDLRYNQAASCYRTLHTSITRPTYTSCSTHVQVKQGHCRASSSTMEANHL